MHLPIRQRRVGFLAAVLLAGLSISLLGAPSEAKLELDAVLVWGTNGPRPADPELKDLQVEIRQKLQAVFKWTDYYEVNRRSLQFVSRQVQKVRLSPKCEVSVENLGRATIEVRLYGEGKLVVKKKQTMTPGELLVLAGEDRNDTAWFVVFSLKTE
jgi:hypothetical protein